MENVEISTKLITILKEISNLENEKLLLWATIYTRECENLKNKKMQEFENYLKEQIILYKRNVNDYQSKIDKLLQEYNLKLKEIIIQYNSYYSYLQNEIILTQSNQKIATANIISSKRALEKAKEMKNEVLIEKANRKIFASAQKKLNYDVVIDEIIVRLKKCMEDTYKDINLIFNIENNVSIVNNTSLSFLGRIRMLAFGIFTRDKNFKKNVLKNLDVKLKDIELNIVSKKSNIKTDMIIFISQLEKIRKEINLSFNEVINKA